MNPRNVNLCYHHAEDDSFWVESDDVPGFVATGQDLAEVRRLARVGLATLQDEILIIDQEYIDGEALNPRRFAVAINKAAEVAFTFSDEPEVEVGARRLSDETRAKTDPPQYATT